MRAQSILNNDVLHSSSSFQLSYIMGQLRDSTGGEAAMQDARFASMHKDPRFSRFPKKNSTVEIDKRFSGMFSDPEFQSKSAVDKRGRKVKQGKRSEDLKRYYHLKDEAEWKQDAKKGNVDDQDVDEVHDEKAVLSKPVHGTKSKQNKSSASKAIASFVDEEEDEVDEEEQAALQRFLRARGMLDVSSSDDEDEDEVEDSSSESDDEAGEGQEGEPGAELSVKEWGVGAMAANPEEKIPLMDETKRIAIVDLDWDHVKAVDILAVLRSFAPTGADVVRVTVYPSDYGLQRMAEEVVAGPKHIFKSSEAKKGKSAGNKRPASDSEEDGDEVDKKRLAMYEKSKLRYYYAIVECRTVVAASHIYAECDGLEFERSACKFDLRFVPDDQSFEGRQVRDSASSVPTEYEPPVIFNLSLQHTDPKLTWDADDEGRKRVLHKKMTEEEIKEADFQAYLGSDDEDDDIEGPGRGEEKDAEKIRDRYRSLLLGATGKSDQSAVHDAKSWNADDEEEEEEENVEDRGDQGSKETKIGARIKRKDGMEMEVTFVSGLEKLGEQILSKKKEERDRAGETVWEAYLRKRKEKRKERKKRTGRGGRDEDSSESDDYDDVEEGGSKGQKGEVEDDPFDDPFFKDGSAGVALSSEDEDEDGIGRNIKGKEVKGRKKSDRSEVGKKEGLEGKASQEDSKRQKAELELLMMDDVALREATLRGMPSAVGAVAAGPSGRVTAEEEDTNNIRKKKQSRKERLRFKKEQRRAAREGSDEEDAAIRSAGGKAGKHGGDAEVEAGFKVDLSDPRFADLFEDQSYALDPTDPRFAKTKGSDMMAKEVVKRRSNADSSKKSNKDNESKVSDKVGSDNLLGQKSELKAMIAQLKRKAHNAATSGDPILKKLK
ncbi:hypothetical protein CEUSTIGMA_g10046.t1 [Chlamydomonas eustigma]|uniref:Uncharacterized protein n=1 Tax=Chlamydomonas eustigma TaxID=1157962 RepID=A0A250XIK0_9CHLO|nr:hypothetical protein CEUSTIGMA_g10046.t1 [Chlamydomonas eustigma]|eukprot:GAX82620.1 hypothetical protein CEUSTIGMA_g10046.t1 [Chlamydomonas eustigma]